MTRLRPPGTAVRREIDEITEVATATPAGGWRDLRHRWLRPALLIAVGIAAFFQLTGINAVVYYAPTILVDAGFGDSAALLTGIGIGVTLVIAGVVGAIAVDRAGRRRIMLWFLPVSGLAMAVMTLAFLGPEGSAAQRWAVIVALFAYILFQRYRDPGGGLAHRPGDPAAERARPGDQRGHLTLWGVDLLIAVTALMATEAIGRSETFFYGERRRGADRRTSAPRPSRVRRPASPVQSMWRGGGTKVCPPAQLSRRPWPVNTSGNHRPVSQTCCLTTHAHRSGGGPCPGGP
ncbi:MFS transporter [Streptomyces sp. NPDC057148]|uniref:MFS transporter n=1 Tax=unclassified Streptomyces TaxID=2593676 RepID=UPI00362F19F5